MGGRKRSRGRSKNSASERKRGFTAEDAEHAEGEREKNLTQGHNVQKR